MNNMKKATLVFAVFMVFTIGIAIATYYWHMTITWTLPEKIGVYTDFDCQVPYDHTLVLGDIHEAIFYIRNEGSVSVDVTIINEAFDPVDSGTASWSPTSLSGLQVGSVESMTLTLTLTADGSYDFDFASDEYIAP